MAAIPELNHLCKDFPPSRETWPTLLLIGRDNVWAMGFRDQLDQRKPGHPMAAKMSLGWALMGPKVAPQTEKSKSHPMSEPRAPGVFQVQLVESLLELSNRRNLSVLLLKT